MKFIVKASIVCVSFSLFGLNAQDHSGDVHELTEEICDSRLKEIDKITEIDPLLDCVDFYWHATWADPYYNKVIQLEYRVAEIDPEQTTAYTAGAWLLASKWVEWRKRPKNMPDGEFKMDEAISFLKKGRAANSQDSDFILECGTTIAPFAKFYNADLWPFVLENYALALKAATTDEQRVRILINFGSAYRNQMDFQQALESYRKVLEIEPKNKAALLNSAWIHTELKCPEVALTYYDVLLSAHPNISSAYSERGAICLELGRKEDAKANFEAALAFDPANLGALEGLRHIANQN